MNENIPIAAARLLDLIGSTEAPRGYGTIYGNHQSELPKPLIEMTLAAIIGTGPRWTNLYGSSACGRYQFMTATLKSLMSSERLKGSELFEPDFQDSLGYALLDRRGFEKFVGGMMSVTDFGLELAKEWASFPVLAGCRGAHRMVQRGETFYAGDRQNRALIAPQQVEAILASSAILSSSSPGPVFIPSPLPPNPPLDPLPNPTGPDGLTPINRMLGSFIGQFLNGYKTSIGAAGLLGTTMLDNYATKLTDGSILSSLHDAAPALQPLSAAMLLWGVMGKVDKWVAGTPSGSNKPTASG